MWAISRQGNVCTFIAVRSPEHACKEQQLAQNAVSFAFPFFFKKDLPLYRM